MSKQFVLLHEQDNVLVCCSKTNEGEQIEIELDHITLPVTVDVGHKIARAALAPGQKIIKYGASIGSLTQAVAKGELVHIHNMKSDYIPSHTRESKVGEK